MAYKLKFNTALLACLLLSTSIQAFAALPNGFLLFPGFNAVHVADSPDASDKIDSTLSLDVFYAVKKDRFNFLGEYFKDKHESELERFQLGWNVDNHNTVWLGRFHSPIGYWNSNFHHGLFLQTSISRPAISSFEDDGGILPMHMTGFLLEGFFLKQEGALSYNIAVGNSSQLTEEGLEPLNILNPNSTRHNASVAIQVLWQEDITSENLLGASFAYSEMTSDLASISGIRQTHASAFANEEFGNWRVIAAINWLHNDVAFENNQNESSSFTNIYTQIEYAINDELTVFGRVEDTFSEEGSAYLDLLPDFISARRAIGMRFDFFNSQAITLEISRDKTQSDSSNIMSLQWSMLIQ